MQTNRSRRATEPEAEAALVGGTITAIKELERRPMRRSLHIDGHYLLTLHAEVVARRRWKVGLAVSTGDLQAARDEDLRQQACELVLRQLAAASRSRHQLAQKLARAGFSPELAQETLVWAADRGLIDDQEFARQLARGLRSRSKPMGPLAVRQKLAQKGIRGEAASAAVAETYADDNLLLACRQAAHKQAPRLAGLDRATAQRRLAAFLQRRGFTYETIGRVLHESLSDYAQAGEDDQ